MWRIAGPGLKNVGTGAESESEKVTPATSSLQWKAVMLQDHTPKFCCAYHSVLSRTISRRWRPRFRVWSRVAKFQRFGRISNWLAVRFLGWRFVFFWPYFEGCLAENFFCWPFLKISCLYFKPKLTRVKLAVISSSRHFRAWRKTRQRQKLQTCYLNIKNEPKYYCSEITKQETHSHIILNLHFHHFQQIFSRIERPSKQRISQQASVTAISFKRMSDAIITSYHGKVFLTDTLHANVTKFTYKHDPLLWYA